ncbi:MAG: hypothetical protein A2284_15535 [Deltaproteobacteria bacterium RIFOXYA12_FULL_61_11]|nr:MAG: hypothetical protein A2284_15535 [Deltaproteobacteria bacterium RIFOXYA12_FULL_61_11]
MLDLFNTILEGYNSYIGQYLVMILLVPAGLYFTVAGGFLQLRGLKHAVAITMGRYDRPGDPGDVNHFKALTTALSATVGTGNIVGVALAIYYGGPGAIFWMWVTGFLGMMTKFVCCTLAVKYRQQGNDGSIFGGPMYYMTMRLKTHLGRGAAVMATFFALGTVFCSMGSGNMAQSNSMASALEANYAIPTWISGLILGGLIFLVIVGGIRRIAQVASRLVPFMSVFYMSAALVVIFLHLDRLPSAFALIFTSAFQGTAATGGFLGATFLMSMRWGIARGLFSNEAGQGSAPIAHAAAKTEIPVREGYVALLEPFIDTLVICTMTALVIVFTEQWSMGHKGAAMTVAAFEVGLTPIGLGFLGKHVVAMGLMLFAFSTALSWSYYGDRAAGFLFGPRAILPYRVAYCVFFFLGSIWGIDLVWNFADAFITFMTIPNLIALLILFPEVRRDLRAYQAELRRTELT